MVEYEEDSAPQGGRKSHETERSAIALDVRKIDFLNSLRSP